MEFYEIVLVIHPNYSDQLATVLKPYVSFINKSEGIIHALEDWGRIKLSYPIEKLRKAHYVFIQLNCKAEMLKEFKEMLRYNESILRHLVLKIKSFTQGQTIMAQDNIEETKKLVRDLNIRTISSPQG